MTSPLYRYTLDFEKTHPDFRPAALGALVLLCGHLAKEYEFTGGWAGGGAGHQNERRFWPGYPAAYSTQVEAHEFALRQLWDALWGKDWGFDSSTESYPLNLAVLRKTVRGSLGTFAAHYRSFEWPPVVLRWYDGWGPGANNGLDRAPRK